MPCRSDHMEQNAREASFQRAANLLVFVLETKGKDVPKDVRETADTYYAEKDFIPQLCAEMKKIEKRAEPYVYVGKLFDIHNPISRDLADWWDQHKKDDARHDQEDREAARQKALDKLTPYERKLLGV